MHVSTEFLYESLVCATPLPTTGYRFLSLLSINAGIQLLLWTLLIRLVQQLLLPTEPSLWTIWFSLILSLISLLISRYSVSCFCQFLIVGRSVECKKI